MHETGWLALLCPTPAAATAATTCRAPNCRATAFFAGPSCLQRGTSGRAPSGTLQGISSRATKDPSSLPRLAPCSSPNWTPIGADRKLWRTPSCHRHLFKFSPTRHLSEVLQFAPLHVNVTTAAFKVSFQVEGAQTGPWHCLASQRACWRLRRRCMQGLPAGRGCGFNRCRDTPAVAARWQASSIHADQPPEFGYKIHVWVIAPLACGAHARALLAPPPPHVPCPPHRRSCSQRFHCRMEVPAPSAWKS
jgi:hypothetical protein